MNKYNFIAGLEWLQQAFVEYGPSWATVFHWYGEFKRDRSQFGDEDRPGR